MCGSTVIDGYTFYLGVTRFYEAHLDLESSIRPITSLIRDAIFRPKHAISSPGRASLKIRPLGELIDMFHTYKASLPVDKVYALLGMSSDDPSTAGLLPNYKVPWKELFKDLVKFVLGKDVSVETSKDSQRAVIKSKGCILGQVSSIKRDDRQHVNITSRNASWDLGGKTEWTLQASAKPIEERDIICILHGSSKPTIIRPCKDHFAIIVIAATPLNEGGSFGWPETSQSITHFLRDFFLVWDWEKPLGESQDQEHETLIKANSQALEYSKVEFGDHLDKTTRLWDAIMILDDSGEYEKADERLLEARRGYVTAFRKEHLPRLNSQYGRTPLSFVAGEGHEDIVKVLFGTVDPDLKDGKSGRTPLSWAAANGHKGIVKLLLATEMVDADSKDKSSRTPLWWAAANGHEGVVKLLLATEKVDADSKDKSSRTPLWWAAENGHEGVVKLLLATEKVDADSKDKSSWTPLWRAASNGHEGIVKLLLATEKVDADLKDKSSWTPLSWAAANGHKGIVKLLLATETVDADSKDKSSRTPLWWAAANGHEGVVKLLLATEKVDADSKDKSSQTPLRRATENGHEDVVKLLLATKKVDADSKDKYGQTLLWLASRNGHDSIVKLLLATEKVDADSKNKYGQTLQWLGCR